MAKADDIYDAVVVGGGIVGLAAALALNATGQRVAVVERAPPARLTGRLGFDIRTVALTPKSVDFLAIVAADDAAVSAHRRAPIRAMHVWEQDGGASLTFAEPSPLAWVAENSAITTSLWQAAADRVDLFAPATVVDLDQAPHVARLTLAHGSGAPTSTIAGRLVVAADGENSRIRALSAIAVRGEPPPARGPQRALATIARTRRAHGDTAWQRFGPTGPVALLPLTDERTVAVIWSTSETVNGHLQGLDDGAFATALAAETEAVTGGFDAVDRRISFPLRQSLAADLNPARRILLVGDAARTLHPLAGQGVNVGLEDVRALVAEAQSGDDDLGARGRWRDFARHRRRRSKAMIGLMRALLAAYCGVHAGDPWMRLARNMVVRGIDATPAIKAQLIREAMGLGPLSAATDVGDGALAA